MIYNPNTFFIIQIYFIYQKYIRFPVFNIVSEASTNIDFITAFRYPQPNSEASGHSGLYQWR